MRNYEKIRLVAVTLSMFANVAHAQTCVPIGGLSPMLRSEGQTELVGPILVNCTGLTTGQSINLDITINNATAPITSRSGEAMLTITQAGIPYSYPGTAVSQGTTVANNDMSFTGIDITDPGPLIAISGIRVDANPLYMPLTTGFAQVFANVLISGAPISQNGNGPLVGTVLPGLGNVNLMSAPAIDPCAGTITLPPGSAFVFSIPKSFPTALKVQGFAGYPPGSIDSESGPNPNEPQANSATQLAVTLGGTIPSEVTFYLPTSLMSDQGGVAQLVTVEGGSSLLSSGASTLAAVPGTTYFYNVAAVNPAVTEAFSLAVTTDPLNPVTLSGTLAPSITVNLAPMGADLPSNVPAFMGGSNALTFGLPACSTARLVRVPPGLNSI